MGKLIIGANLPLPAPFNAGSADPMDTRQFIETKADLTNPNTYGGVGNMCFVYPGLKTYVLETNEEYTYMGPFVKNEGTLKTEVSKLDNWVKTADKTSAGGLSLRWQDNKIQLVSNWTNQVISEIDGTDFIKDGLLDNVSLLNSNLVFSFNTDSSKQDIIVDLSKFVDTYTAGNGIDVNNKELSVNLNEVSEFTTLQSKVNNLETTKADIDDLSNVLAEQVIDTPLLEEINTLSREELKKDLFIDMWKTASGTYNAGSFGWNDLTNLTYELALNILMQRMLNS